MCGRPSGSRIRTPRTERTIPRWPASAVRTRTCGSAVLPTASASPTPSTARGRRWWSPPAGSATCSTTGRARCGGTSCATSAGSPRSIRYDERGHGLSDRDVDDFSLEARIGDLEAVVEHSGVDRFAVMAMSQGGPVAIRYVRRPPRPGHPDDLLRLVRRRAARPDRRGPGDGRGHRPDHQGGLVTPDAGVPPGLHDADDPGRERGADVVARRAPARRGHRRHPLPRPSPAGARRRHRRPRPADGADPDPALGRRPDERLRAVAGAGLRASPTRGWCRWRATTTSCSRTSRRGGCSSTR